MPTTTNHGRRSANSQSTGHSASGREARTSTRSSGAARASGRTLKSPLAAPGGSSDSYRAVKDAAADAATVAEDEAALDDRASTMAEFEGYLRTVNNRDGRPYEEKTVAVYLARRRIWTPG